MSRVGKLPIIVPNDIKVELNNNVIKISKASEVVAYDFGDKVSVIFENGEIRVSIKEGMNKAEVSNFYGLHRNNISNIVKGLIKPFDIVVEINGVGYRANVVGDFLILGLGYSHDIAVFIPKELKISIGKPNLIIVEGSDKELVGKMAASIISLRKTEPYKGKGIKKVGQYVVRKEGKKK